MPRANCYVFEWKDDAAKRSMVEKHIPMGRSAESDEIPAAFAFLASDDVNYITGLEANWTQLLLQLKTIEETNDKDRKANVVLGLAVSLLAGCARD